MEFKTAYSVDVRAERKGIVFEKPSRTKQSFAEECDLNRIMERYALPEAFAYAQAVKNGSQPIYDDFTTVGDYQEAMNIVLAAQEQFDNMPSNVRAFFDNDPVNMLQFVQKPEQNYEKGVELGLFKRKDVEVTEVSSNVVSGVDA